jgi:hypothetical protein
MMTLSIITFSTMRFSITALSIMGLFVTLSITTICNEGYFAECRVLFICMLSVVMLNVVAPSLTLSQDKLERLSQENIFSV